MNKVELIQYLKTKQEIEPDKHDGSYELMREIVGAYATLNDFSSITYRDLDAIYMMIVGSWKCNVEKKKDRINLTCLPDDQKQKIKDIIDKVWDNACFNRYENKGDPRGNGLPSIGMFGTGFMSFKGDTSDDEAKRFIQMCVDIYHADDSDSDAIFSIADKTFSQGIKGMGAASASVMLHCLKPTVFPILNNNMQNENIFIALGVNLKKPSSLDTYIENCRAIKAFRDSNFYIRNYRVFDLAARDLYKYEADEFIPTLEEYNPNVSKDQYVEYFTDSTIINKNLLDILYYMYLMGGTASCKEIELQYGNNAAHYNANALAIAKTVHMRTDNCDLYKNDNGDYNYWPVLFQGRPAKSDEQGEFIWKLRTPLAEAIAELDRKGFFEDFMKQTTTTFDHNTILYGPPGTGKTYNSVVYAVAIIENKSLEEIQTEDYLSVKARFDEYKKSNRIAFTTFHQSYGYEEFIEGIKPVVNSEGDEATGDIEYKIIPGLFKKFCERAMTPVAKESGKANFELNSSPTIWKISLAGTKSNPIRTECLENNHIRIAWDGYGEEITENTEYTNGGKVVINSFISKMRIGDIVLSCFTESTIDAVGVITGDYEWHDEYENYKRLRNVNWIVKGINENIVDINNGTVMTLASVYRLNNIELKDVLNIIDKYSEESGEDVLEANDQNYVFVIDEINRGNISKIFGELITLIENTKRIGAEEEMMVKLPYSGKDFGVPNNVYILGTMNTADRSIALMDTALRRRFSFVEMMPKVEVLENLGIGSISEGDMTLDVLKMLDIINKRIEFLFDREHTIGHAFFTGLKDDPSIKKLSEIFKKNVIPLLQEYFYEDYEKIQLVLGDNKKSSDDYKFIISTEETAKSIFNGNPELDAINTYAVNDEAFKHLESFIEVYESVGAN